MGGTAAQPSKSHQAAQAGQCQDEGFGDGRGSEFKLQSIARMQEDDSEQENQPTEHKRITSMGGCGFPEFFVLAGDQIKRWPTGI